jgi:hypothetical protein
LIAADSTLSHVLDRDGWASARRQFSRHSLQTRRLVRDT